MPRQSTNRARHNPELKGSAVDTAAQRAAAADAFPTIHEIPLGAPFSWLRRALKDFAAHPRISLFYGFCYAAMGLATTLVFANAYQYAAALVGGFLLLGPFLAMGLYEISRCRAAGEPVQFGATLTIWRRNAGNIALFALVLMIVFLVWARASLVVFALFYEGGLPTFTDFLSQLLNFENLEFLGVYFGVGLLFAALVFAASLVSIPLMLDRNQDAVTAVLASVIALVRNPGACLIWALTITVLTGVGFLTFHLGLIVLIPLIGFASWHAYTDLVEPRS